VPEKLFLIKPLKPLARNHLTIKEIVIDFVKKQSVALSNGKMQHITFSIIFVEIILKNTVW